MAEDNLSNLREQIENREFVAALEALVENLAPCSPGKFEKRLIPLVAECFQPQWGSANHGCLLLNAYKENAKATKSVSAKLLRQLVGIRNSLAERFGLSNTSSILRTIELRINFIHSVSVLTSSDVEAAETRFSELLDASRNMLSPLGWQELPQYDVSSNHRPAAFHHLSPLLSARIDKWIDASEYSWLDPTVAMVVDTVNQLDPDSTSQPQGTGISAKPNEWLPGHSYCLLALTDETKLHPDSNGMLLVLRIEVLQSRIKDPSTGQEMYLDGCGVFYPDPIMAGHIITDKQFQSAFRDAWQIVLSKYPLDHEYRRRDYRWSLTAIDPSSHHHLRKHLISIPLSQSSASLPIAAGLRSAVYDEPLDQSRASSAAFQFEGVNDLNPQLVAVEDLDLKDYGITSTLKKIQEFVTHQNQSAKGLVDRELLPAENFDQAYGLLSKFSILTKSFKQIQYDRAQRFFVENCFAKPLKELDANHFKDDILKKDDPRLGKYVLNSMIFVRGKTDEFRDGVTRQKEELNLVQVEEFLTGQDHGSPIRIIADSAVGKSAILERIRFEISSDNSSRLAILLNDGLSDYLKRTTRRSFLEEICRRISAPFENAAAAYTWLDKKVDRGEVVFLFDALDQTATHFENLQVIVQQLQSCQCYVTLRPDAIRTKLSAFGKLQWIDIELSTLLPSQSFSYLEDLAYSVFPLASVVENRDSPYWNREQNRVDLKRFPFWSEELQKVDLTALDEKIKPGSPLTIPLILYLLRIYGRPIEEGKLQNVYQVYDLVICGPGGLIANGLQSLARDDSDVAEIFHDRQETIQILSQIALWQMSQSFFETALSKKLNLQLVEFAYSEIFKRKHSKQNVERAIKKLDLLTANSVFESNDGLVWRHRSFLEFLAGRRLAELLLSEDEDQVIQAMSILKTIHATSDSSDDLFKIANRESVFERYGIRNQMDEWHQTLRFALAHSKVMSAAGHLDFALNVLCLSNPWLLFHSVHHDKVSVSSDIEALVSWICPITDGDKHTIAYEDALRGLREALTRIPDIPNVWWSPEFRDADVMANLIYFVNDHQVVSESARGISQREAPAIKEFLDEKRWVKLPRFEFEDAGDDFPLLKAGLSISDFPVTNGVFEAFSSRHRFYRGSANESSEQPVIVAPNVAVAFCRWLSAITGGQYRLPSVFEWQMAARWGRCSKYWWGDEFDARLALFSSGCNGIVERTRTRSEAIEAFTKAEYEIGDKAWHPSRSESSFGLVDIVGNVAEWAIFSRFPSSMGGAFWNLPDTWGTSGRPEEYPWFVTRDGHGFRVIRDGINPQATFRESTETES